MRTKLTLVALLATAPLATPGSLGQETLPVPAPPPAAEVAPPPAPAELAERIGQQAEAAAERLAAQLARQQAVVERSLAATQRKFELAQAAIAARASEDADELEPPEPPDVPVLPDEPDHFNPFAFAGEFLGGESTAEPLVIAGETATAEQRQELREDLNIMARVLTKSLGPASPGESMAMGIVVSTFPGARRPQAMYLDGYGAVFLLNVQYPLMPPPATETKKTDRPTNTTWEEAKRELYGPRSSGSALRIHKLIGHEGKPVAYDPDRVERLKRELTSALKNAGNIRHLKGDDFIVIVVSGGGARSGVVKLSDTTSSGVAYNKNATVHVTARTETDPGARSTLTIRAKKSDVDDFAAGKVDFEQFRKRASLTTY